MKFICLLDNLRKIILVAEKIALKKTNLPILENILILVENKKIEIITTDLEISFNTFVQGKIEKDGMVLAPARTFLNFLNNFPEERITLEQKDANLVVELENLKTVFPTQNPDNYPPLPKIQTKNFIELEISYFLKTINRSFVSISTQDFKPEFDGVFIKINEEIKVVTTDGARLSEATITDNYFKNHDTPTNQEFILPKKTAQFLLTALEPEEKSLKLFIEENQVCFETNKKKIISRLIDGKFPTYEDIIPVNFSTTLSIEKNKFYNTLKMASVFTSRLNEVKLKISPKDGVLYVNSQNELQGTFEKRLAAKIDGKELEITFNNNFLMGGVDALRNGEILLGFNEPNQPVVFKNLTDASYFYILMPLRV